MNSSLSVCISGGDTVQQCVMRVLCLVHTVSCEPSFTRFMTPIFGNMLGGTPITITLARGCSEQISGTPMCIFDDTETAAAVDDSGLAASGQHYFCSVPMFETAATPLFEFRAQLNTAGHGTLSLFGNFFLCECLSNCVMHDHANCDYWLPITSSLATVSTLLNCVREPAIHIFDPLFK